MASTVLRSMGERVTACARWVRRLMVAPTTTTSSEHVDEESPVRQYFYFKPEEASARCSGATMVAILYKCLSTVLFKSLCAQAEESLSAALFTFSFAYSIAGLYMLLNGICNPPPSETPSRPSVLLVVSLVSAAVHLANAIYVYRGDFQRLIDGF
ncbi:hypothetical protein HPB50_017407 [Hyalomma asiaticum]|uniref:Uncharacterized protein n=1 Tax=Hyalomma asiaticum TaxID=266040 RepID=A0ACB7SXC7_HYAAI|nr:hypothetical protein HPB50_017407 [Hyalomma asiaticum]